MADSPVPAPRPLTAEPTTDELLAKARQVCEDLDQAPWDTWVIPNNASDVIDSLVATVEQLQAEVDADDPHGGPGRLALMRRNGELRLTVEQLQAEVGRLTADLAAADAVVKAVRQWGPYTPRRVTRALADYESARAAQPQEPA